MENRIEKRTPKHSFVNINEGKTVSLDGVINIERFDERCVSLFSSAGKIEIEGEDMKIESLTRDDGVIVVHGKIEGVFYCKDKPAVGFFKKIFG